jgi:hypothetical protein
MKVVEAEYAENQCDNRHYFPEWGHPTDTHANATLFETSDQFAHGCRYVSSMFEQIITSFTL